MNCRRYFNENQQIGCEMMLYTPQFAARIVCRFATGISVELPLRTRFRYVTRASLIWSEPLIVGADGDERSWPDLIRWFVAQKPLCFLDSSCKNKMDKVCRSDISIRDSLKPISENGSFHPVSSKIFEEPTTNPLAVHVFLTHHGCFPSRS